MPGLTGLEVIAAARAVPGFAHVPIVMVTSLDQRSLRHEALRAGATDFLTALYDSRYVDGWQFHGIKGVEWR